MLPAEEAILKHQFEVAWRAELARMKNAQALDDAYRGTDEEIALLLKDRLSGQDKLFQVWENKFEAYLPIMAMVVDRLAGVYKNAPTRTLHTGDDGSQPKVDEAFSAMLLKTNWTRRLQEIERQTLLHDVVPVVVTEDPYSGFPRIDLWLPQQTVMTPSVLDSTRPVAIWRMVELRAKNGGMRPCWERWCVETHEYFMRTEGEFVDKVLGAPLKQRDFPEELSVYDENPYGRIPVVVSRLFEDEMWGTGQQKLLKFFIYLALGMIVSADQIATQTYDQMVLTDIDIGQMVATNTRGAARYDSGGQVELKTGRRYPMILNTHGREGTPTASVLSFQSHLTDLTTHMDWAIKQVAAFTGIPLYDLKAEGAPELGRAKWMSEQRLVQRWTGNREIFRSFERELYTLMATVWNLSRGKAEGKYADLPEDADLKVDYPDYSPLLTPEEEWAETEKKMQFGLINPLDVYKRYNPDTQKSDEEILAEMRENKSIMGGQTQPKSTADAARERLKKIQEAAGVEAD